MIFLQADNDHDRETMIVIVIEPDNLHRMEQADPITLEVAQRGGMLKPVKYPEGLRLMIAYEPEPGRFYEMIQQGRTVDMLRDLMRGYKFQSKDGEAVVLSKNTA